VILRILFLLTAVAFLPKLCSSSDWDRYDHPEVVFFFPAGWTAPEIGATDRHTVVSRPSGPDDPFQEKIVVSIRDRSTRNLAEVAENMVREYHGEVNLPETNTGTPGEYGRLSGVEFLYVVSTDEGEFRHRIFVAPHRDRLATIHLIGRLPDYEQALPAYEGLAESLVPLDSVYPNFYFDDEFAVQYPDSWILRKGLPGTVAALISPLSGSRDKFRERVTIGIDTLKGGMGFEEYSRRTNQMLLQNLKGSRKVNETTRTVSGKPATELELSHRTHGPKSFMRIILVSDGKHVLNLICTGENPEYEELRETFDRILNSFASLNSPDQPVDL